jgi:hypothetical protein
MEWMAQRPDPSGEAEPPKPAAPVRIVQALPEPAPEPGPQEAPEPEPEPAPQEAPAPDPELELRPEPEPRGERESPEPSPTRVGPPEFAEGEALLDAAGAFPVLSFSYEDFPSFRDYARAMSALGARFVAVRHRQIVGAVDPASGAIAAVLPGSDFSPRARDYTGEVGLAPLARVVRERFGPRTVVMMIVPRSFDAGLFGGLSRALAERGVGHEQVREIRGRYLRGAAGGVRLRVEGAVGRDGSALDLEALFDLGQIAGGRRA